MGDLPSKEKFLEINKEVFLIEYCRKFGNIKDYRTTACIEAIIDYMELNKISQEKGAYVLATAMHEAKVRGSESDFYPMVERGSWVYITSRYYFNPKIRRALGNKSIKDAWRYRGHGLPQLTGRANYIRHGVTPKDMLEVDTSVRVLFEGMLNGSFTGVKLERYVNDDKIDYINARRTVNGVDRAADIALIAYTIHSIMVKSSNLVSWV